MVAPLLAVVTAATPAWAQQTEAVAVGLGRESDSRVLQVAGTANGAAVTAQSFQAGIGSAVAGQRWTVDLSYIVDIEVTPVYRFRNVQSGKCLTRAAQNVNNAAVTIATCDDNSLAQMWTVPYGGAWFGVMLQSMQDYRCLDLSGGSSSNGAPVRVSNCIDDWAVDDWYQR